MSKNCEDLLWEHLSPMICLRSDNGTQCWFGQVVAFPRDCIEVLRCRPFRFTHKVVNRWFDKRTILIGDAAHVFPPFAGQGIGSGFRDAHQLAWRLALLVDEPLSSELSNGTLIRPLRNRDRLLNSWEKERRTSVDDAAYFSMLIGKLCNEQPSLITHLVLKIPNLLQYCSFIPLSYWHPLSRKERQGFAAVREGFHHQQSGGGIRLAQIHLASGPANALCLSDSILRLSQAALSVLAIAEGPSDAATLWVEATNCIMDSGLDACILAREPVIILKPFAMRNGFHHDGNEIPVYTAPAQIADEKSERVSERQNDVDGYFSCLGKSTRFVIARSDCFVYALARNITELSCSLAVLRHDVLA